MILSWYWRFSLIWLNLRCTFIQKRNLSNINCRPIGWLYNPVRMRNISWKKSRNFQRLPLSSILYIDLIRFSENRDKEFQLGSMHTFFNLAKLRTISLSTHFLNCVHIWRSQTIEAIIGGLSEFLLENISKSQ